MLNDETFDFCSDFIPCQDVEDLAELTGFGEEEILEDYLLSCSLSEIPANFETWSKYKEEQEADAAC